MRALLALSMLVLACLPAQAHDSYPRLFGMQIGDKHYDDPVYQRQLARLDIAILGFYRGWGENSASMRTVVRRLKHLNPRMLVGQYTILNEASARPDNDAEHDKQQALRENGWWLKNAAGRRVQWTALYDAWDINITRWSRPDGYGRRYPEWLAARDHRVFFEPVPEFDIWYFDNVMSHPRIDAADWKLRGNDQSGTDHEIQRAFRRAQAAHWKAARSLEPDALLIGNPDNDLSYPEYRQRLQGAFLECLMGEEWSLFEQDGWEAMMARYHAVFAHLAPPRIVAFHAIGAADDYRLLRFALASSLMNDGYFSYTDRARGYSSVPWFDEYDADLGQPRDPPQRQPWKNGVYRRHFERGMVLLNPNDTPRRIVLEPGYRHLRGTQDTRVNNGRPVHRLTLGPRDAVLLVVCPDCVPSPSRSESEKGA